MKHLIKRTMSSQAADDPGIFWVVEATAIHAALALAGAPIRQGKYCCTLVSS